MLIIGSLTFFKEYCKYKIDYISIIFFFRLYFEILLYFENSLFFEMNIY